MDYLLKFKHGLQASMKENSPELAPGTVYITRDERAMYVDLPPHMNEDQEIYPSKRIRIGDMRVYSYIEDLKTELANDMSALTDSALYYAEKSKGIADDGSHDVSKDKTINALLKWNGSEFIQLNSISDVTVNLNELTTRVANIETNHESRIATMETFWKAADNPDETIDKLAEIVNYINSDKAGALDMAGDIQDNTEAIEDIKEDIAELSNNLTTEITARETGDTNTLNSAKEYVDSRLIWEQF